MENKEQLPKPNESQVGPVEDVTFSGYLAEGGNPLLLDEDNEDQGMLLAASFEGNLTGPEDKWV